MVSVEHGLVDPDPRRQAAAEGLAYAAARATGTDVVSSEAIAAQLTFADDLLFDVDQHSVDATVRRLQQTVVEQNGGDPQEWNLERAMMIVAEIDQAILVQKALVRAFVADELEGGREAAYAHPLWEQARVRIDNLREEMKGLI